jgi:hypothetical protein
MNASQAEPTLSASPITPEARTSHHEVSEQQAARFIQQFSAGMLAGLRQFLARTHETHAWQDRILMLDLVAAAIPLDVLETACAIEPDAADLAIVRCAYYSALTLEYHSAGAQEVSPASVRKAGDFIRAAMTSLETAAQLDPADPTPFACIMGALGIFPQLQPVMQHAFDHATAIAPELAAFLAARQLPPAAPSRPN